MRVTSLAVITSSSFGGDLCLSWSVRSHRHSPLLCLKKQIVQYKEVRARLEYEDYGAEYIYIYFSKYALRVLNTWRYINGNARLHSRSSA